MTEKSVIPPGYVLEKDLPRGVKDEVDAAQMAVLFKDMGEDRTFTTSYPH